MFSFVDDNGYINIGEILYVSDASKLLSVAIEKNIKMTLEEAIIKSKKHISKELTVQCDSFYKFCLSSKCYDAHGNIVRIPKMINEIPANNNEAPTDAMSLLMLYHHIRFVQHGSIVYKIRPYMTERLKDITLSLPCELLITPHKEFAITIPWGKAVCGDGKSLVGMFVSTDPFEWDAVKDDSGVYDISKTVKRIAEKNKESLKRVIRVYGFFLSEQDSTDIDITYCQIPLPDGEKIQDMFNLVISEAHPLAVDPTTLMFNMTLNLCAYLSTKDPDTQNILGIKFVAPAWNPKKSKEAAENNKKYGYNYVDVGRIYDTRYISSGHHLTTGKKILKRFKVRTHIRAQWYGPSVDNKPGTEQKLIIIEEFEKGADFGDMSPKTVEIG